MHDLTLRPRLIRGTRRSPCERLKCRVDTRAASGPAGDPAHPATSAGRTRGVEQHHLARGIGGDHPVAPARLGMIERRVRAIDQILHALAVDRVAGDAEGTGQFGQRRPAAKHPQLGDRLANRASRRCAASPGVSSCPGQAAAARSGPPLRHLGRRMTVLSAPPGNVTYFPQGACLSGRPRPPPRADSPFLAVIPRDESKCDQAHVPARSADARGRA